MSETTVLTVFPEVLHKLAGGVAEQRRHIVVQGVHVLRQPGRGIVVHLQGEPGRRQRSLNTASVNVNADRRLHIHLSSVMQQRKLRLVFQLLRLREFYVASLCVDEFFDEGHVCSFGEPALLVQEGQDTRGVVLQAKAIAP